MHTFAIMYNKMSQTLTSYGHRTLDSLTDKAEDCSNNQLIF